MLISIHVHIGNPFGFLFCYIPLFILSTCVFVLFVCFFTEELVPTGPCITLFICMTLIVGVGEPGLLGSQAVLAPRIIPS